MSVLPQGTGEPAGTSESTGTSPGDGPRIVPKLGTFGGLGAVPQRPAARPTSTPLSYMERPGMVTAAATLMYVGAAATLILCAGFSLGAEADYDLRDSPLRWIFPLIFVGSALFNVVLAAGIQNGNQWARITTLVFCWIAVVLSIISLLATGSPSVLASLPANIAVMALLYSESAQAYFARS